MKIPDILAYFQISLLSSGSVLNVLKNYPQCPNDLLVGKTSGLFRGHYMKKRKVFVMLFCLQKVFACGHCSLCDFVFAVREFEYYHWDLYNF